MNSKLIKLLHLSDPTLPIGAYTHSNGLETYVQYNLITNKSQLKTFIQHQLRYNLVYNDVAFVRFAYIYAQQQDFVQLQNLSQLIQALKSASELRNASLKLGQRLLKIFRTHFSGDLMENIHQAVDKKTLKPHYPLLFGIYAQVLGASLEASLEAFLYNLLMGMITNGVKLVPLGQLDGQAIFFELESELNKALTKTMQVEARDLGRCSIGIELRSMQHESLYSRLYMS